LVKKLVSGLFPTIFTGMDSLTEPHETFIHAPEIDRPGLAWLNTPKPLSLADVKGKLVILDFWTFCCINCMHILPTLRKIEEAFSKEVMVIGVHSPKFAAEKNIENLRQSIARYDIRHPVIHDPDFVLWGQYDVHAWPTLVFIDPNGRVIGKSSGEPEPLHLLNAVRDAVDQYDDNGTLDPRPFTWSAPTAASTPLSFPGKIKPLPGNTKQWIVADSGHHQIVVLEDDGREIRRYGSGQKNFVDGAGNIACFNNPQGLIANEDAIFVADTGNHALRRIDRATGMVTTLAGTGERGYLLQNKFEAARGRALASPWDLEIKHHILFFANAGTHQIGGLDLNENVVRVIAGGGGEGLRDGALLMAEMAQPSGLAFDSTKNKLYIADSETSALRVIHMAESRMETLIGAGLFDFGDRDGRFADARLQHALGVCLADDSLLFVADSYNNAIRRVDLPGKLVSHAEESGWTCEDPVCLPFAEPAGIWADTPQRLLVSDTNNHRIVEVRLDTRVTRTWNRM
jgi:thiol-disulfide isomerase/thioredoxin/sugar lactone lactonase YvrE